MGEMVMDATNYDGTINYTTNWTFAGGSLPDSVSFESSFSTTTANHESDDGINPAAVDHTAKSPLLLLPPVPNGDPCEITSTVLDPPFFTFTSDITFAQEHELRQVYIRSTARVYEVYYTKKKRNDREYLCTVRCGVAMTEDEEVLKITPLIESPASENGLVPVKDDWVEVKCGEKDLLSVPQLGQQDLFEATAEIDDAEPCVSVTLRLLSLQDKRCDFVHIVSSLSPTKHFIIHSRKALLSGLSPADNRRIPPLKYEYFFALLRDFPDLKFTINGGINSVVEADAALRSGAHGVMLGRAAFYNPWHILGHVDTLIYGAPSSGITRRQVLEKYRVYGESVLGIYGKRGPNLRDIVRPLINLFHSEIGNGQWKRRTDAALLHCTTMKSFLDEVLPAIPDFVLDSSVVKEVTGREDLFADVRRLLPPPYQKESPKELAGPVILDEE
ncbi:hypothetical protein F2Q69_00055977 [Brassica cretica]|uniref:DUS-like FMN-binding domain-containing protein n=1 Tax=Brassica cretica TaxID=69181 RepID=A0A8S9N9X1_BRACR|nr:hypothetical protein F2Q69_00055977 [Brassica cretica]